MASDPARNSVSDYEPDSLTECDYQSGEPFSIDLLLSRVEELQRSEKLVALQKLTQKNALLQELVIEHQQQWCCTLNLLEKTHEAQFRVQQAVAQCVNKSAAAERTWLGYWGQKKQQVRGNKECATSAGWI
jgi:hypothetical protein